MKQGTVGTHRSAPPRPATVLVTDAGKGSAVAFIRSLARRGMRVVAADSDPDSPGMRSRYASARLCYPVPSAHPDRAVETLLDAAGRLGVDLIIPVTDDLVLPLSAARDRFAPVCRLALPEPAALAATSDKQATLTLAQNLGIPTPATVVVTTAGEAVAAAEFGWPVVIKPGVSRRYRSDGIDAFTVGYANSPAELRGHMEALAGRCPVLLQEYCAGEGHGVELLMDGGRLLAAFQHRRLHEVPVTGGASSLRESVRLDPVLLDYSVRLMGALSWTGLAMVEFKVGPAGPRLMEVNGRVWGSLPLAVKSGMDFPARLADLYLPPPAPGASATTEPATSYVVGRRSRNLWLEILWIGTALSGRRRYRFLPSPTRSQGAAAALRLLNPADGYDVLDRHDPGASLAELRSIGRQIRKKAARP